jgi:TM2 domain-containing membrane protein YozV
MLAEAPDSCVNEVLQAPIKRKGVTLALSIFLGGIGIDRFYLGDKRLGIAKIAMTVATLLFSRVVFLGELISIARSIWGIVDIFLTYKKSKELNYNELYSILKKVKMQYINKKMVSNNYNKREEAKVALTPISCSIKDETKMKTVMTYREVKQHLIAVLDEMSLTGIVEDFEDGPKLKIKIDVFGNQTVLEISIRPQNNIIISNFNLGEVIINDEINTLLSRFNLKYAKNEESIVFRAQFINTEKEQSKILQIISANYFLTETDMHNKIYDCVGRIVSIKNVDILELCNKTTSRR